MITLHALLVRRSDLSHEQFLAYWHGTHGPLIRDNPDLTQHLLSYHQFPVAPQAGQVGLDAYDGITVQTFPHWDAFWAFATQPASKVMNDDMANFLDVSKLAATITETPVAVVEGPVANAMQEDG